jgi:Flp pilus assembly protein TadD
MKHALFSLSVLFIVSTLTIAQDFQEFDEGVAKFKAKEYDAVIKSFTSILDNPAHKKQLDEDLYFYRGQAYFHTGEYRKSIDDLDQSLLLKHYHQGVIHWYKARCYDKLGKTDDAKSHYKEALTYSAKNKKITAQILADRAQFFARHGDKQAAEADLALAKSTDPTDKDIAGSKLNVASGQHAATTPARTAGEEKKTTQVIVRNNSSQTKKQDPTDAATKKNEPAATVPTAVQQVNTGLVPALATAYKDEKRYALVIGNSNYSKDIGILKNPVNDATDVATELRKSDFEVQLITNCTYVQLREAMRKFHEKLTNGPLDKTVGLFYYAGHGVQFQDENYLVPIDADVKFEDDITRMCFPVQRMVLANMERSNSRMNIVILDACRNNPFPATTRSVSSGLGEMKRARGSFIAYATSPGSVASDGSGRNGLYTQELLKALRKPNLTIEQVFKEVRMNVLRLSGDKQYTWDSSNIIGEFYFKLQ